MKIKMWCLMQGDGKTPIKISVNGIGFDEKPESYVIGFDTKQSLINAIGGINELEYDEEIRKIEGEIS